MTPAILGLYGIYFLLVAYHGNTETFLAQISTEKNFVPWVIAILVLGFLSSESATHELVAPFTTLLITAAVVTHWNTVNQDVSNTYDFLTGKNSTAATS